MKSWSERTRAQKVGILGVFGVTAVAAIWGLQSFALADAYWEKKCNPTSRPEDAKTLGAVMRFDVPLPDSQESRWEKFKHLLKNHDLEEIKFVGGARVVRKFEGGKQIRVIDYSVNCMYPPFSVGADGQSIGHPPVSLPAYCHVPSASSTVCKDSTAQGCGPYASVAAPALTRLPSPAPTPTASPTPDCSALSCPISKPEPAPEGLAKEKLQDYLKRTDTPGYPSYLQSVGALKVALQGNDAPPEFWASGFVIADKVFATTCHAMEPLFVTDEYGEPIKYSKTDENGKPIKDPNGPFHVREEVMLSVDFRVGDQYPNPAANNLIKAEYKDCSDQEGLDVALLSLTPEDNNPAPPKVPVFYDENFTAKTVAKPAALISYGDLSHPIDQITSEMYASFAKSEADDGKYWPYRKFVMWDGIYRTARCENVDYLLDTAGTTVGSSGALVLAIFKDAVPPPKTSNSTKASTNPEHSTYSATGKLPEPSFTLLPKPLAIGLHKCCSAYFGEEEQSYGQPPTIPCAALHRSPLNQDVSSKSILEEPKFCKLLTERHVQIEDYDGNQFHLECSDHSVVIRNGPQKL